MVAKVAGTLRVPLSVGYGTRSVPATFERNVIRDGGNVISTAPVAMNSITSAAVPERLSAVS
ncbi:MAG TPA: hypothetical protein VG122_22565 [Gemmata sp.]|jgi:hypothetical protein|nr:hypothetical protein [Gemmata sp.]